MRPLFKRVRWWIVAATLTALYANYLQPQLTQERLKDILSAVLAAASVAGGFIGTALSVLLAITDRPIFQAIEESGALSDLTARLMGAIRACFFLALCSCVALFVDYSAVTWRAEAVVWAWFYTLCYSGLTAYDVLSVFGRVLRLLGWGK